MMNFLVELKRRSVVRVAIVYTATAFVVLQAADLLSSGPALPSGVFGAITVVTVLGFPLAVVLSWLLLRRRGQLEPIPLIRRHAEMT